MTTFSTRQRSESEFHVADKIGVNLHRGKIEDAVVRAGTGVNVIMVAVHAQSEAQYGSIAGLAVNDSVIARSSCSGQFDFKKRDAVGWIWHPAGCRPRKCCLMCATG